MKNSRPRLLRITTVPISLHLLLKGQPQYMEQHGFEVLTASAEGRELQYLKEAGVKHRVIPLTRTISPAADLKALFKMIQLIREFKPDIVHTHTPKAGLIGMMAARLAGVPVRMHTVAGLPQMEARGVKKRVLNITEAITCFCAQKVYPNSFGLLNYLNKELPSYKNKFKVLAKGSTNGVNTTFFSKSRELEHAAGELRATFGIGEHDTVFCFIGRIVGDKGINELLTAFNALSRTHPIKLLLTGMLETELDPLNAESMQIIENNHSVINLGYQHDVRIPLTASDVFVFPSYREGFPNVVMQAMCMEVPCIVSDINGCNELIRHEESGLIIPVKQVEALKHAMLWMIGNREERLKFASRARALVVEHFEQQHVWELLLQEYREMLQIRN